MTGFALQALAAFNLVCSVVHSGSPSARPETERLRVDLEQGRFCLDNCRETFAIQSATDTQIVFQDGQVSPRHAFIQRTFDRQTGRYYSLARIVVAGQPFQTVATGTCEIRPFTRMPRQRP